MNIGPYSFDEYIHLVKSFHGHIAPGMIIGGIMVDTALNNTPAGDLFDALCETENCLPDAVQLLTPCTVGNGWLRIVNFGRYAVTLYEKYKGDGVRVYLDPSTLDEWPAIKEWFFKLKQKKDQNSELLYEQIRKAGAELCKIQNVHMHPRFMEKRSKGDTNVCPLCGEAFPSKDGEICRGCGSEKPYTDIATSRSVAIEISPPLRAVPVEDAVGRSLLHDMTRIVPNSEKGPAFRDGQVVKKDDINLLLMMGKKTVYVKNTTALGDEWVHENEVATRLGRVMAGDGVTFTDVPSEGKVTFSADRDGLLVVDEERLINFNCVPDVMCASRQSYTVVSCNDKIGGTRAIPLYLSRAILDKALVVLNEKPLFTVLPLRQPRVGILVTGTEVYEGLVEDGFAPLIRKKLERLGAHIFHSRIVPDDRDTISGTIKELINEGIDLLITTGGLSVDPDDLTRAGLEDAGATDMLYGVPILPGAMTLLARIGDVKVIGVPAGALYFKTTSFDLLVPRLLAGLTISRYDLARMSSGAFCLECPNCTFPLCPFGR
ncbi:MAG: trehalose-binding protein [Deltaproteobacteria bacterium]|nr:trehalose-binding protein [Deltaproteobacteria bacterium]